MVSYCLSPGGHTGSSLSSIASPAPPGGAVDAAGSSSEIIPPEKNEPGESTVCALTQDQGVFAAEGEGRRFDLGREGGAREREKETAEEEMRDEDAIVGALFGSWCAQLE